MPNGSEAGCLTDSPSAVSRAVRVVLAVALLGAVTGCLGTGLGASATPTATSTPTTTPNTDCPPALTVTEIDRVEHEGRYYEVGVIVC